MGKFGGFAQMSHRICFKNMKKILIISFLLLIFAFPVFASNGDLETNIVNILRTLIELLIRQIALLQARLVELQQVAQLPVEIIPSAQQDIQPTEISSQSPSLQSESPQPQLTTITISKISNTEFSILNNGPKTIRIKRIVFINIQDEEIAPFLSYKFPNSPDKNWEYDFGALQCEGAEQNPPGRSLIWRCARYGIGLSQRPELSQNDVLPQEMIIFHLIGEFTLNQLKGIKYTPDSIQEIPSGQYVSFADFPF